MKSAVKEALFLVALRLSVLFVIVGTLIGLIGSFFENHKTLADLLMGGGLIIVCLGFLGGFILSAPRLLKSFLYNCILQVAKIFANKVLWGKRPRKSHPNGPRNNVAKGAFCLQKSLKAQIFYTCRNQLYGLG